MRPSVPVLLATALLCGCAGVVRPTDLRPASHPLLESIVPRTRMLPISRTEPRRESPPPAVTETPAPAVDATRPPDDAAARRARKAALTAVEALIGARTIDEQPATDIALVRAVYGDHLDGAATLAALRRGTTAVATPRPADLVFFHGAGGAAELAVVRSVGGDGVIDAIAVTRGAVRPIVVDPAHPHARRRAGRVVNTFLRARRKGDEDGAAYLAGQLLIDARALID